MQPTDPIEKALANLPSRRIFVHQDQKIHLAFLLRQTDWRPLKADWWKGKEACIIGADLNGNFLLRHCDGSVRYWNHTLHTDTKIAQSVKDFTERLSE